MPAILSNTLRDAILQDIADDTPYLALYTSNPGATDAGTEVSGGSYARQAVTFGAPSGGVIANTNTLTFTMPLATVTHWAIRNASTAGTLKISNDYAPDIPFQADDQFVVAPGELTVTVAGT